MKSILLVFLLSILSVSSINETEYQEAFVKFKATYNKQYSNNDEELHRYAIFKTHFDFVDGWDAEARGFTVAINKFADLTSSEFVAIYNGYNRTEKVNNGIDQNEVEASGNGAVPDTIDWEAAGAVTGIKNQGECGSCWSFSATGAIEGANFIKTGILTSLSEQNLIDCTPTNNYGCSGGDMDSAFLYVKLNGGIDTEESYPYLDINDPTTPVNGKYTCNYDVFNTGATILGYNDVPSGDENALKIAASKQPISVAIDASHPSFQLYSGGIYYEPACSSTNLDHGVLVVGYGSLANQEYWKVKNSWGTDWGMDGYILMARDMSNNCGIATSASYPIIDSTSNITRTIAMRDGIKLYTKIYLPSPSQPQPTVLLRTSNGANNYIEEGKYWAENGFNFVVQEVRGSYSSQGNKTLYDTMEWIANQTWSLGNKTLYEYSAQDSYDTMEWIANQTWSNKNIFTIGNSTDGITQYLQPKESPSWLKGQAIGIASPSVYDVGFQNGAFRQEEVVDIFNMSVANGFTDENIILNHEPYSSYWDSQVMNNWTLVDFPVLHYTGWYDVFQQSQLDAFMGYQQNSSAPGTNYLIIGPGGHCASSQIYWPGDSMYSMASDVMTKMFIQLNLKGDRPSDIPIVSYYILGPGIGSLGNVWDVSDTYPPRKSEPLELYLSAKTLESNYALSGNTSYVYDPEIPVPTIGGNTASSICGPQDQTPLYDNHSDIISFTSEPLSDHLLICGRTSVVLYVSSNATDTDFTAKLVDVFPDSRNMLVQDGIIRMRWRDSLETPTLMTNGTVYEVTIDLWSICYVFNPGHKIRLDISSSNFPRFSVNPNNGLLLNETNSAPFYRAENTIYYGSEYPSRLILTKPYDQTIPVTGSGAASLMLSSLLIALVLVIHLKYQ